MYIKGKKYKSRQNDMFIRLRNGYKGHDLCWYGNQDVFLSVLMPLPCVFPQGASP